MMPLLDSQFSILSIAPLAIAVAGSTASQVGALKVANKGMAVMLNPQPLPPGPPPCKCDISAISAKSLKLLTIRGLR
jgi:hypothetical protein